MSNTLTKLEFSLSKHDSSNGPQGFVFQYSKLLQNTYKATKISKHPLHLNLQNAFFSTQNKLSPEIFENRALPATKVTAQKRMTSESRNHCRYCETLLSGIEEEKKKERNRTA
ncbi:hypothetical protein CEXT_278021 [Caerostris extrusa]|uniref:Uncharacterized protein n=1 Tax=Caerostris extrusa TaxID=172846 RepID=A0AAV4X4G5_CAEEX|nr:hypothetical protein CEXT_278021 [Caerostris extrusa]